MAVLVALVAWVPQIGVLFRPSAMGGLFAADSACPRQQPISQDPHYYYSCILHWAWGGIGCLQMPQEDSATHPARF